MGGAREVDDARKLMRKVLDESAHWLVGLAEVPAFAEGQRDELLQNADTVRRLRTRAGSALINLAMLGSFSSGKSFLLSGLQGALELVKVRSSDGILEDKYVGLLPSSPVPTTACPARVIPVDGDAKFDVSGTGFLRVLFTGHGQWEDVGNSPAPSVVAAYAMGDEYPIDRLPAHRRREVAEIEILLGHTELAAKLYDLPGHGSPNPIHDQIVKAAMADSDCFIYVSHASRSLSETDLELIRFLYEHYMLSQKRVIWVLTAIDSARQLDHRNVRAWEATVEKNNTYLRSNFQLPDGRPDAGFIGAGFQPVSPALEAQAAALAAAGQQVEAEQHAAASKMGLLRQIINDLIEQETGRKHIAAVAGEARAVVLPLARAVGTRLEEERLPIAELQGRLRAQNERISSLQAATGDIRESLEKELVECIKRSTRNFTDLAPLLHADLDAQIKTIDVWNPDKANRIHVAKTQIIQRWMKSATGPATRWEEQFAQFMEEILRLVASLMGSSDPAGRLPAYSFQIKDLTIPQAEIGRGPRSVDVLQRTAAAIGISAPVVAGGSWLFSVATASAAFPPAGAAVGIAALVYAGVQFSKNKSTALSIAQQEWISSLNGEVSLLKEQFGLAMLSRGQDLIDALIDNLGAYRRSLERDALRLTTRSRDHDIQRRQGVVDQLEPLWQTAQELMRSLDELSTL